MSVASETIVDRVRSAFNFSVDKFPLSGPDGMRTPWYALFRSDTDSAIGNGSVTAKYVPHTTEDVIALCDAASVAFDGIAEVDCYFRDGHYVVIEPTKADRLSVFGEVDNVWPRVIIRAGYDGKAFKASVGYYRDMCRNLHIVRSVRSSQVSIRHSGSLRSRMDDLIAQFSMIRKGWSSVGEAIARMERNRVSMVNFLETLYGKPDPDSKRAVTEHTNRTEAIFKRLQREANLRGETIGDDFTVSGWLAFNAVQGYIQHDATRKGRNRETQGASVILSLNDQTVFDAEHLALSV